MLPYQIALKEYGTWEWAGKDHNPEVLKYAKEIGLRWVKDDETAWCSIFVNWCLMKAGRPFTREARAKSFLKYGVSTKKPELGDIVVFWRESKASGFGHVAFYISESKSFVYVLGGNQNQQVNISRYSKKNLLDYRKIPETTHA